jgi:hypothetical protein
MYPNPSMGMHRCRCVLTDGCLEIFGELEYIFGCFKLMFITMLIVVCGCPSLALPTITSIGILTQPVTLADVLFVNRSTSVSLFPLYDGSVLIETLGSPRRCVLHRTTRYTLYVIAGVNGPWMCDH